ncbi:23S rRNA pseudouridine(1911/1915/1917) synthase RluD [Candidatus Doolittlea endobia]|uniref:Pseudouridine synthase n=1 Tax=Candidatus Doolittlea endobia TaxID=1778262 RepID=A0A143WT24_9ENTR|nr:23S rRNA pseudouridine(1911/1915/1917) synthase RluD [Candidatus Doolittlea endobia]CUX96731.1 Ribosomal large subunit pseudouridine synthase D [Candidatus Doolittlea endobia]
MAQYQYLTATVNTSPLGRSLMQVLSDLFPDYSRSQIKTWILNGLVRVNGQVTAVPKEKILGSISVEIQLRIEESPRLEAQSIPLDIVYEDNDILVINKPRDLVVHPGAGNFNGTVLNALLHYFPPIVDVPRAGIVHRLDKDTTGLMVVAKTVLAYTRLVQALQVREITREYEAVAIGTMTAGGTIKQPTARHAIKRKHITVHPMGKLAVTHYRVMERFRAHTRLRLRLETGRTHQIRVHMAHIKHPLVGDPLYGGRTRPSKRASDEFNELLCNFNRQALHATLLRLCHPITLIKMEWHAPLPQDMVTLIAALQVDAKLFKDSAN